MLQKVLVVDNGGYTIKTEYVTANSPRLIPNCLIKAKHERKRVFIGDQINDCKDLSSLFYLLPFQKGFLVNWDIEHQVWDYVFGKNCLNVDFPHTTIILTEPHFNFRSIQETTNEVLFEDYQFSSVVRLNAGTLSAKNYTCRNPEELCCLVVDSGFSFTHIVPYFKGKPVKEGIVRVTIGGKALTNHLKEIVSYRQLQVLEETFVMNQCKEDSCYVSDDFWRDMDLAKRKGEENTVVKEYVLPDFTEVQRGYLRDYGSEPGEKGEQVIKLNHERFTIPEILFHPSDVGVNEMGVAEAVVHSVVKQCHEEMRPHLLNNILLTGGNCLFPGFKDRMEKEIRSMTPDLYDVRVIFPENPITYPWEGGIVLGKDEENLKKMAVTRKEYEEQGSRICWQKFDL